MGNPGNGAGKRRLDRSKKTLARMALGHAEFQKGIRQLQEKQVLLDNALQKMAEAEARGKARLADAQRRSEAAAAEGRKHTEERKQADESLNATMAALAESQKRTDESMKALIRTFDEFIRRRPPSQQ